MFSALLDRGTRLIGVRTAAAGGGNAHDSDDEEAHGDGSASATAAHRVLAVVLSDASSADVKSPTAAAAAVTSVMQYVAGAYKLDGGGAAANNDRQALGRCVGELAADLVAGLKWRELHTSGALPGVCAGRVNCAPFVRAGPYMQRFAPADGTSSALVLAGSVFAPRSALLVDVLAQRPVRYVDYERFMDAAFVAQLPRISREDSFMPTYAPALLCAGAVRPDVRDDDGAALLDFWRLSERALDHARLLVRLCTEQPGGGGATLAIAQQQRAAHMASIAPATARRNGHHHVRGDLSGAVEAAQRAGSYGIPERHALVADNNGACVVQALFTFALDHDRLRAAGSEPLVVTLAEQYREWSIAVDALGTRVLVARVEFAGASKSLPLGVAIEARVPTTAHALAPAAPVRLEARRQLLVDCDPVLLCRRSTAPDVDPLAMLGGQHQRTLRRQNEYGVDEAWEREFALRRYEQLAGGAAMAAQRVVDEHTAARTVLSSAADADVVALSDSSSVGVDRQTLSYYVAFIAHVHARRAALPELYASLVQSYRLSVASTTIPTVAETNTALDALVNGILASATCDGWRVPAAALQRIGRMMDDRLRPMRAHGCALAELGVALRRDDGQEWAVGVSMLDEFVCVAVNFYLRLLPRTTTTTSDVAAAAAAGIQLDGTPASAAGAQPPQPYAAYSSRAGGARPPPREMV